MFSLKLPLSLVLVSALSITGAHSQNATVVEDDFNGTVLDAAKWRIVPTTPSSQVWLAGGRAQLQDRAYLATQADLHPEIVGPIRVRGVWNFGTFGGCEGHLYIWTRCDAAPDPGNYYKPYNGLLCAAWLGNCPNTNYYADIGVDGAQTTITNLQQSGPLIYVSGADYEFEVIDSGAHVSFRISQIGNPQNTSMASASVATIGTSYRKVAIHGKDAWQGTSIAALDDIHIEVQDCNGNGVADRIDVTSATSADANGNWIPDECEGHPFCAGDDLDPLVSVDCPCMNFGSFGRGCANSVVQAGASLNSFGTTSPDTIVLSGADMPASSACIYVQGDQDNVSGLVFGDGIRCIDGALVRLRLRLNAAGASQFPVAGDPSVSARGGVTPGSGQSRYYQVFYRNPVASFCPPATFNMTNGVALVW